MLIPAILILLVLSHANAEQVKRDNSIDFVGEPINSIKFFARNFAQVFVKQKPVDFTRLKSLSTLDLSQILDNGIKLNQAVPESNGTSVVNNVTITLPSKVVEVKPVKMIVNTTATVSQVKTPSFTSLKVVENREPASFGAFRGVFDGFKNVLKSKLSSVFKKRPLLESLISSLHKPQTTTVKNKVIHEHKIVFIKAKIPILTGKVVFSTPDDAFDLIEVRPINDTLSFNNNTNSSGVSTLSNDNPETKNITLGTLFSTFNVTVPQFITSINNLTLPLPISHIFGFMAKKKIAAEQQQQQTEKITRLNRPVIFLGRFPSKDRQTRQFGGEFGGGGFPMQSGFGGGGFIGSGFHHRGGSNFNNNNMNGGGIFRGSANFNNNNMNGGFGGSNFNNNNFNDYDGGSVNFNNNNGR